MISNNSYAVKGYRRSPFGFPSKYYETYQENGTKYLRSLRPLSPATREQLNACAGEIFLTGIPFHAQIEQVAELASLVGELYVVRFKVNFSGASRGFAYLQYVNTDLMTLALAHLPKLFQYNQLATIRVHQSRNSCKLLLKRTYAMSPNAVHAQLQRITDFRRLVGQEVMPGCFEYQITFRCNQEAVFGRRALLRYLSLFGRDAFVVWDNSTEAPERAPDVWRGGHQLLQQEDLQAGLTYYDVNSCNLSQLNRDMAALSLHM